MATFCKGQLEDSDPLHIRFTVLPSITLLRVIPTMTFIRFNAGKSSGILPDILSGILSGIPSGILSGR